MANSGFGRRGALLVGGLATIALSLAACGSKEPAEPAEPSSMAQVRQEAAELQRPLPGQYRQTTELKGIDVPGMPKEAADRMMEMMQKAQVREFCLTAEEADKGFRDMFENVGRDDGECTYSRFDVNGGTLDARMECKTPGGGTGMITLAGNIGETGSDVTMSMDVRGGSEPMGNMKMKMRMKTERLGDCPDEPQPEETSGAAAGAAAGE